MLALGELMVGSMETVKMKKEETEVETMMKMNLSHSEM